MNLDSCSGIYNTAVLEDIFSCINNSFYDGVLPSPSIHIGIIHGNKHGRFVGNIYSSTLYEADEIIIDGDILNNIDEVMLWMLHCAVISYSYHNNIKISSRGGFYYNKQYQKISICHGLIIKSSKNYGFEPVGISDSAKQLIKQHRWNISMLRDAYTYGKRPANRHQKKYYCPICGQSCWATSTLYINCDKCANQPLITD